MGGEVTLKGAHSELGRFVDGSGGSAGAAASFFFQSCELFEELEYTQRRVSGLYSQGRSVAVGFDFLIFGVAGDEDFDWEAEEIAKRSKITKTLLGLDAFRTMPEINVLDFVSEYGSESVFTLHESQQAGTHEDVAAGQGKCIDEGELRDVVEMVMQLPFCVKRDFLADLLQI